jgi:desulfoferrodoxin (superoxide reductase-like protein)
MIIPMTTTTTRQGNRPMFATFFKPGRRAALLCALAAAGAVVATSGASSQARAQARSPEQVAASIPTEVPEVHTGGSWQDGNLQGVFRTITVLSTKENTAHVFIQWISLKADNPIPEIAKTVAIKEVTEKKLPNAFVTLEADKEGEATIVVASFDPATNKDVAVAFKASKPGVYAATKLPDYAAGGATGAAGAAPPAKK